jgi:hypothetical protein
MACYLNSYKPICMTRDGRNAIVAHNIPPFVDGSIRREPDFELKNPSITSLCRPSFVGRLQPGDKILYLTNKYSFTRGQPQHRRLAAILKVKNILQDHNAAATWYQNSGSRFPYNCVVRGNSPLPLCQSAGLKWLNSTWRNRLTGATASAKHLQWNAGYAGRASSKPTVAVCEVCFLNLQCPPVVNDALYRQQFGNARTQNAKKITCAQLQQMVNALGIQTRF